EPSKSVLLACADFITTQYPDFDLTLKYGMPCFVYLRKPIVYLWKDKLTFDPYLLFVYGNQIQHPKLETGDRKKMKILRIRTDADLPFKLIQEFLNQSL